MADPRSRVEVSNQVDGVLQDYLDQLLISVTAPVNEPQNPAPQKPAPTLPAVAPITTTLLKEPSNQVVKKAPTTLPQPAVEAAANLTSRSSSPVVVENKMTVGSTPSIALKTLDWRAGQGVECLVFKVAGLKLAIPLSLLGGVYPVNDKITPLFGQAKWSLGVWQGDDLKLTLIDTAVLMMPERGNSLKDMGYGFFIQLDRSPWALACQEICDTHTLNHDSIKWRGDMSKRPWLAGTVIDEMCALIDVQGVLSLLEGHRSPHFEH